MAKLWLIVSSLFWFIIGAMSFSVDISNPYIYNGTKGEYFGFSVALHVFDGRSNWLLVGAPLSNKTSNTKRGERYGSVSWCETKRRKRCSVIAIDNEDPRKTKDGLDVEKKTGQWLGGTLLSTGTGGKIVTCAPRYTLRGNPPRAGSTKQKSLMIGRCFYLDNKLNVDTYINPCYIGDDTFGRNRAHYGRMRYGLCQSGFSAALTKDGVLAMGIPGTANWKGSIVTTQLQLNSAAQKYHFAKDNEMKRLQFGDIMGYATTTGYFKNKTKEEIASASPRSDGIRGRVTIFDIKDDKQIKVSSSLPASTDKIQVASYFGSALCGVDLNNDGFSELLVGAPFHTVKKDEGRVYVYMNNGEGALRLAKTLNGDNKPNAKFGFSIASAGDLNQDGFNDVIIGAPYEDDQGAIYVYFGSRDGINEGPNYPRQKITPSLLKHPIETFGHSLTGGVDMDNNGYPDIGVGAFGSDKAILLRTRPIVSIQGELRLNTTHIALADNTSLCKALDGNFYKCIDVKRCFKFSKPVRDNTEVQVSYDIELEKNKYSDVFRRVYFQDLATSKNTFKYRKTFNLGRTPNLWQCEKEPLIAFVRRKSYISDFLSAMTFDMTYELSRPQSCSLCPVFDAFADNSHTAEVNFEKQCGPDKKCEPDLAVQGEIKFPIGHDSLVIGFTERLWVKVDVDNKRHDAAYPGKVVVTFPPFLGYIGPEASQRVQCTKKKLLNENGMQEVECVVGNPFLGKRRKSFLIEFSTIDVKGNISHFDIQLRAKSPSEDFDYSNNNASLKAGVKFETDLKISGSSEPDQLVFNGNGKEVTRIDEIGPLVQQYIIVRNTGPSSVDGSTVSISIPSFSNPFDKNSYLFYLISVEIQGGSCDVTMNPRNFELDDGNFTAPIDITEDSSEKRKPRIKRDSTSAGELSSEKKKSREKRDSSTKVKTLDCEKEPSHCTEFTCRLAELKKGDSVEIKLSARLWQNTLMKASSKSIDLVTTATVRAPNKVSESDVNNNKIKIFTRANPVVVVTVKKSVPWWMILAAVLGGVFLLALLAFVMWKVGFFRRKKLKEAAGSEEEMQTKTKEAA